MLYVAMTRGRDNSAVIYQRITGEADHEHSTPAAGADTHSRGSDRRPVIGKIDRMGIGPPPRRARAARSTIQTRTTTIWFRPQCVRSRS